MAGRWQYQQPTGCVPVVDVTLCCALLAGYVDRFKREVIRGSAASAAIYQKTRYQHSNPYQNHPMLPFGILPRLSPLSSQQAPKQCTCCLRELAASCFRKGNRLCYVCGCIDNRIQRGLQ
jgi:hypothetical protein